MKTIFATSSLLVLCAASQLACATADEEPTPAADSGVLPVDSATTDATPDTTAADTGTPDTMAVPETTGDTGAPCVSGKTETRACGFCGSQSRFCLQNSQWTSWTDCTGEKGDAECKVGDRRTSACGNCGKQTDFCDIKTCTWTSGLCSAEGECEAGSVEHVAVSCGDPVERRTRTCSSLCKWSGYSECGIPTGWQKMSPAPIIGRQRHVAVWTGSKMLVWGGYNSKEAGSNYRDTGAAYELATDQWATLPVGPLAGRRDAVGAWTGTKMIVWGGATASTTVVKDGAAYDPASRTWTTIATSPLAARAFSASAWSPTTNELLIWGGCTSISTSSCTTAVNDGAAYNPATNTWTAIPAAPISARGHTAHAFVNGELVIVGGSSASTALADGARYNPATRTWTKFSALPGWTPRHEPSFAPTSNGVALYGGLTGTATSSHVGEGLIYTSQAGSVAMPALSDAMFLPSSSRHLPAVWSAGNTVYVFSGMPIGSGDASIGFAAYDMATGTWSNPTTNDMPGPRANPSVVWTGREAIIWGGAESDMLSPYYNDGAIYR